MTNATAVVRPLPGSGLVVRAGDLLLVCADGGQEVDDLLGLVAEIADAGGDGGGEGERNPGRDARGGAGGERGGGIF